jgi:hypothetical protein
MNIVGCQTDCCSPTSESTPIHTVLIFPHQPSVGHDKGKVAARCYHNNDVLSKPMERH